MSDTSQSLPTPARFTKHEQSTELLPKKERERQRNKETTATSWICATATKCLLFIRYIK
jgi:hypothetical protein